MLHHPELFNMAVYQCVEEDNLALNEPPGAVRTQHSHNQGEISSVPRMLNNGAIESETIDCRVFLPTPSRNCTNFSRSSQPAPSAQTTNVHLFLARARTRTQVATHLHHHHTRHAHTEDAVENAGLALVELWRLL